MKKIVLNMAISLDGYISDNNGGFDWITGHNPESKDTQADDFLSEFMAGIDIIVMGSKAYEDVVLTNLATYEDKKILVATNRTLERRDNVEFIRGDLCGQILKLKKEKGRNIWLYGGAELTDSFIKADLVDEYIIGIIPTILGNGRALFKGNNPKIDLYLDGLLVSNGITILSYMKRQKPGTEVTPKL